MSQNVLTTLEDCGEDELNRCHIDDLLELGQASKDEQLSKMGLNATGEVNNSSSSGSGPGNEGDDTPQGTADTDAMFKKIVENLFCDNADRQLMATLLIRRMLSTGDKDLSIIDLVVQAGVVPRCIQFLQTEQNLDLQFEAAWVLVNITAGNQAHTNAVVDAGAVELFVDLLQSPHIRMAEQAVWALGNIAGDCSILRDLIISKGSLPPLLALAESIKSPSVLRIVAWTLSNICRPVSSASQEATKCLPALMHLMMLADMEVVSDVCWAVKHLSDGPDESIQEIVESGVIQKLVEFLDLHCGNLNVITACLQTLGNITAGSDVQTQCVIDSGVLQCLTKLLKSENTKVVKEAAWIVSNIAAGTTDQVAEVVRHGIVPLLVDILKTGEFSAQKKEAVWAIKNVAYLGSLDNITHLIQAGVIPVMCEMLKCGDAQTVAGTLECIELILRGGGNVENVTSAIEECGGLDLIEELQNHENLTIFLKAWDILEVYFYNQDEDSDSSNDSCPSDSEQ